MSKELDYDNLSDEDKEWLRARGQGNRIPGETKSDPTGIVLDPTEDSGSILAKTPNVGTATHTLTAEEAAALVNPVNPEGYTEEDYEGWKVPDLKAEINERNEAREDEAEHIDHGDGKKATLVAALVADDKAHEGDDDTEPEGDGE